MIFSISWPNSSWFQLGGINIIRFMNPCSFTPTPQTNLYSIYTLSLPPFLSVRVPLPGSFGGVHVLKRPFSSPCYHRFKSKRVSARGWEEWDLSITIYTDSPGSFGYDILIAVFRFPHANPVLFSLFSAFQIVTFPALVSQRTGNRKYTQTVIVTRIYVPIPWLALYVNGGPPYTRSWCYTL